MSTWHYRQRPITEFGTGQELCWLSYRGLPPECPLDFRQPRPSHNFDSYPYKTGRFVASDVRPLIATAGRQKAWERCRTFCLVTRVAQANLRAHDRNSRVAGVERPKTLKRVWLGVGKPRCDLSTTYSLAGALPWPQVVSRYCPTETTTSLCEAAGIYVVFLCGVFVCVAVLWSCEDNRGSHDMARDEIRNWNVCECSTAPAKSGESDWMLFACRFLFYAQKLAN